MVSFFFPHPFKNEKKKDSVIVRDNSNYAMKGALPLGQDKQVQFEVQDSKVFDWLQLERYH